MLNLILAVLPCYLIGNRKNNKVFVFFHPESSTDDPVPVFVAKPSVVVFTDYSVGHVYEVCFSGFSENIKTYKTKCVYKYDVTCPVLF